MKLFMPIPVLKVEGLPITAPLARSSSSGPGGEGSSATLTSIPPTSAWSRPPGRGLRALHRSPGVRQGGRRPGLLGDLPKMLISVENLDVARPIFWGSIVLFGLTAAALFGRFLLRLGRPADASGSPVL